MQKQYKIYKIDTDKITETLSKIDMYNVIRIDREYIAVEYDYHNRTYGELLEFMFELPVSQYIFMASTYYSLLKYLVENSFRVYEIKLNSIFKDENEEIQKYITLLSTDKKDKILNTLLSDLRWYNYDEGIDICNMSFGIKKDNMFGAVHIANNGVVSIDKEKIEDEVFDIIKEIL